MGRRILDGNSIARIQSSEAAHYLPLAASRLELPMRSLLALIACALFAAASSAANTTKRVLLVTHAGGYMHDSALVAEQVLRTLGPKNGYALTCYRFTADPDARITVKRKENDKEIEMET